MMNSIETYRDCGKKVANAYNRKDAGLAQFQTNWFNRAIRLESKEDQIFARNAYNQGYKENRVVAGIY